MGWTQHTVGVQNIRTMCIIQLLLGNMGIAGGGVAAMRGESNVQGSTDHGLLFHIWPGYIGTPRGSNPTLKSFMEARTPQTKEEKRLNWPKNMPKYIASFLRSMYGMNATLEEAYYVTAQARRRGQLLLAHPLRPDVQGKVHGLFRLGHEPGELRRLLQQGAPGPGEARLDGQRQPLRQRDGLLLERPRHGPDKGQDRGLHAALRLFGREGRQHLQQRPLDAVALQGRQPRGRSRCPTATS